MFGVGGNIEGVVSGMVGFLVANGVGFSPCSYTIVTSPILMHMANDKIKRVNQVLETMSRTFTFLIMIDSIYPINC